MLSINVPIPSIRITPPPSEENHLDPFSPFPCVRLDDEDDAYRTNWSPLPSSTTSRHSMPLRHTGGHGSYPKGLGRDQFDPFSEQRAKFGSRKDLNIYEELVPKQLSGERRYRPPSRVDVLPCTTAVPIYEVQPESTTAVPLLHGPQSGYSSPGIAIGNSENLALVNSPAILGRDEEVEGGALIAERFHRNSKSLPVMKKLGCVCIPPSLDEIIARLKPGYVSSKKDTPRSRLPKFLEALNLTGSTHPQMKPFPIRSLALNDEKFDTTFTRQVTPLQPSPHNLTPRAMPRPIFRAADVVAGSVSHIRAETARDMIVTLRRRSSPCPGWSRIHSIAVKEWNTPAETQRTGLIGFDRMAVS